MTVVMSYMAFWGKFFQLKEVTHMAYIAMEKRKSRGITEKLLIFP